MSMSWCRPMLWAFLEEGFERTLKPKLLVNEENEGLGEICPHPYLFRGRWKCWCLVKRLISLGPVRVFPQGSRQETGKTVQGHHRRPPRKPLTRFTDWTEPVHRRKRCPL